MNAESKKAYGWWLVIGGVLLLVVTWHDCRAAREDKIVQKMLFWGLSRTESERDVEVVGFDAPASAMIAAVAGIVMVYVGLVWAFPGKPRPPS